MMEEILGKEVLIQVSAVTTTLPRRELYSHLAA
jgi:hypothetical protein